MKKQITQFFAISILAVAFISATGCKKDSDTTTPTPDPIKTEPAAVEIPDARLSTIIKTKLALKADEKINVENILKLDSLNLDAEKDLTGNISEISNLTGMEKATNLTYVHIGYTKVTDISPLKDLKKVKYFRINNTAVSDLTPLAAYTSLTYFNANTAVQVKDISALGNNTGLQELILRDVIFGDAGMATIAKFTKLYRLNIRNTGITNISVVGELMSKGALLKTTEGAAAAGSNAVVDLRGNTIADWSPISSYSETSVTIEK